MSSAERPSVPATLASAALVFLASHLVILTLAGFLALGLWLAGVWGDGTGLAMETPVVTQPPPAPRTDSGEAGIPESKAIGAAVDTEPPPLPRRDAATDAPEAGPAPQRPGPRLIGGSIPVYGAGEPEYPPAGGPVAVQPDEDFRPPGLTVPPGPSVEFSREDMLQEARRAFWNGDFEGAEAVYLSILTVDPGDPDTFGELGNLYQAMGREQQALDAYYEAAIRLKARGQQDKLLKLIELLEKSSYTGAAELRP